MAGLYIRYASPMGLALPYFFSFFGANMLKINGLYCFTLCKSETSSFRPICLQLSPYLENLCFVPGYCFFVCVCCPIFFAEIGNHARTRVCMWLVII